MSRRSRSRGYNFAFTSPSTAARYDAWYQYRWWMVGGGIALIVVGMLLLVGITSVFKTDDSSSSGSTQSTNRNSSTTAKTLAKKSVKLHGLSILFMVGFFVLLVCGCILCNCGLRVRAYRKYKEWQVMAQANGINPLCHPYAMDNVFVTPMRSQAVAPYQHQYPGAGYGGFPAQPYYGPPNHPGMVPGSYPAQGMGQPYNTGFNNGRNQGVVPQGNAAQLPGSIY